MIRAIRGLLGPTRRQQVAVTAATGIGLVAAVAALVELWPVAVASAFVLLTIAVVVVLDVRRRIGRLARVTRARQAVP